MFQHDFIIDILILISLFSTSILLVLNIKKDRRIKKDLSISEKRYQDLFNSMVNGFALHEIILDKKGIPCDYRFLAVNPAFEKHTGLAASNIIGRTIREIAPETEQKWIDIYGKVALTGESCYFEEFWSAKNMHFEVSAYQPKYGQFACVFADITGRKTMEKILQENESRLHMATVVGNVGIWDWDITKDRLTWDESMYTLYGLPKDGFGGAYEAWLTALHPDDKAATTEELVAALRGERPYSPEFRIIRPDGEVRYIKAVSRTFYDETGKAYRMLGTNMDITERKRTETLLKSAKEEAEAANKVKSDFLAGISHDLKTPLHAIIGFCSLIDLTKLDAKYGQYITIIKNKATHLSELVQTILEAARMQSGKIQLSLTEGDIIPMIRTVVESTRFNLDTKPVQVFFTHDDFPLLMVDHLHFRQILENLINNAVKYTDQGRVIVTAACLPIPSRPDACRLRLSVKDTGLGISKDKIHDIFMPFVRLNTTSINESRPGMGIGLYIVKTAVDLMKGEISILSEVGKGTEFIVTLDLDKADTTTPQEG
jgi:PAS domain S-box-containing protein